MKIINQPIATNTFINELVNSNRELKDFELSRIIGGDPIDDLFNQIFDYSEFTAAIGTLPHLNLLFNWIKSDFRELASTSVGMGLINLLKDDVIAGGSGFKIKLSTDQSLNGNNGQYDFATNTMQIDFTKAVTMGNHFDTFAHELYHAYMDISTQSTSQTSGYFNDVAMELDAGIFAMMAAIQYDKDNGIVSTATNSHVAKAFDYSKFVTGMDTQANNAFKLAWDDIILNGNFSVSNYNSLITNFKTGSGYGVSSDPTYMAGLTADQSDLTGNYFVDDYFEIFFKIGYTSFDTSSGGNGGSGNNTSGNTGGVTFMNWYNSIQNSGYTFYTSGTTTSTSNWVYQGITNGLGSWIYTTQTTTSYEPTMGQWIAAYLSGWSMGGWSGGGGYLNSLS